MTTLVYSRLEKAMAADTLVSNGRPDGTVSKIVRHKKSGAICGGCGTLPVVQRFLKVFKDRGFNPVKLPDMDKDSAVMVVTRDGEVWHLEDTGWYTYEAEFYTWGTGENFAIGALMAGATVKRAVEIAGVCNPGQTNTKVEVLYL